MKEGQMLGEGRGLVVYIYFLMFVGKSCHLPNPSQHEIFSVC